MGAGSGGFEGEPGVTVGTGKGTGVGFGWGTADGAGTGNELSPGVGSDEGSDVGLGLAVGAEDGVLNALPRDVWKTATKGAHPENVSTGAGDGAALGRGLGYAVGRELGWIVGGGTVGAAVGRLQKVVVTPAPPLPLVLSVLYMFRPARVSSVHETSEG